MVGSNDYVADGGATASTGCHGSAGSYFLPKTYLHINVTEKTATDVRVMPIQPMRLPDRSKSYCLDFLGSPTSNDKLAITKTESQLLEKITANAEDRSEQILKTIADTGIALAKAAALRADPGIQAAGRDRNYKDTFDPFDPDALQVVNSNLHSYGLCVVVPGQDEVVSMQHLSKTCNHPVSRGTRNRLLLGSGKTGALAYAAQSKTTLPPSTYSRGILYRPRLPYAVYVLTKKNRKLSGGWQILSKSMIAMENEAPVLSVGVDRTFFATRSTTLDFQEGMLRDVTIEKTSELESFVKVPLHIAQAIVNLPAQIIQLRIDIGNKDAELIRARAALISAEADLIAALAAKDNAQAGTGSAGTNAQTVAAGLGLSSGGGMQSCIARCNSFGGDGRCEALCSCQLLCSGQGDTPQCARYCSIAQ
ncbi:hypothetical protein [Stappia sp. ES.058]|uniref:hypothetical protein n=1 Tax=Stappia sp. ES.058 TaxID=1881061 RepID=UPI0012FD4065|nr:hypothetical protein [Stappia sp. ES.058]